MISKAYLVKGITGLSRTLEAGSGWVSGHLGAAVIAAYYFCAENQLEPSAPQAIAASLDRMIARNEGLFQPLPETPSDPSFLEEIPAHLEPSIQMLPTQGHHVIFASLAIKALREAPEASTPEAVRGICGVMDDFAKRGSNKRIRFLDVSIDCSDVEVDDGSDLDIPRYTDNHHLAAFTLGEFLKFKRIHEYTWGLPGHLVTHGQALVLLDRLGYPRLARRGHDAHRLHAKMVRRMHDYMTDRFPIATPSPDPPTSASYWRAEPSARSRPTGRRGTISSTRITSTTCSSTRRKRFGEECWNRWPTSCPRPRRRPA